VRSKRPDLTWNL